MTIVFLFIIFAGATARGIPKYSEDATLKVPELITKYGYTPEVHQVKTEDDYLLTLHRILPKEPNGKIAFLQHGLLSSSADWILTGPVKGLAYILSDEGYDVWMGNARGNSYSRNHTHLNPDGLDEFWDFSWEEIGYYDLPAMIDFVLEKTGDTQVYYVGHSQGTTSFFVMASMRPEYNDKIRVQFSLAPVGYMNHMTSPLLHLMAFWEDSVETLLSLIGVREFLPNTKFMGLLGDVLCGDDAITQFLCTNSLFALCGFNPKEMNETLLPVLAAHTPAGAATKQLLHYGQEISSGKFRRYDYGTIENLIKYGSISPPDYDLGAITAPTYLLLSHNDWLASETDVYKLYEKLPNCRGKLVISDAEFNHLDYMYAINAPSKVYKKLISLMARE